MEHLYVGIDGGGSGCRVAIRDRSGARGSDATGGPANFTTDPAQTIANLSDTLARAAQGLDKTALQDAQAHVGLAGVQTEADAARVADALPFAHVTVTEDRLPAVEGALGDRNGALAAVGTGSFVAIRNPNGIRFFGGWGFQVGDQASGAWLGRKAVETCLLAHDGVQDESALTHALFARLGADPTRVIAFARKAGASDFASLAPEIVDAARDHDPNARALMTSGAGYLEACLGTAQFEDGDVLCLSGGLGPHYADYLDPAYKAMLHDPCGTALDGALRLARRALDARMGGS